MNTIKKKTKSNPLVWWTIGFVIVSYTTFCGYYLWCFGGLPTTTADAGTFGDWFGALNALLSGGALVGAIVAILLQTKELKETQKQITLQVQEARETKEELEFQRLVNITYQQIAVFNSEIENGSFRAIRKFVNTRSRTITKESVLTPTKMLISEDMAAAITALGTFSSIFHYTINQPIFSNQEGRLNERGKFLFRIFILNIGLSEDQNIRDAAKSLSDNSYYRNVELEHNPSLVAFIELYNDLVSDSWNEVFDMTSA